MTSLVLTVRVVEAALRETGDRGDGAGENVVNVALLWPRPGKAEVLGTTGLVRLRDHVRPDDEPDRPAAFDAPVLKEVVEGDVALLVHVLDRDVRGAFARFLRGVAASVIDGAPAALGSFGPGLLRLAFTEAAERGSVAVGNGQEDERLDVVAVAARPVLVDADDLDRLAASGEPRRLDVPLTAPHDLARPREKGRLAAGRANGHHVLELKVRSR
jgi:hypothetical protein